MIGGWFGASLFAFSAYSSARGSLSLPAVHAKLFNTNALSGCLLSTAS